MCVRVYVCLENVCVSVYVLGMYVCRCVGGVSRVCVFGNVCRCERGCVFLGNVWVGVYGVTRVCVIVFG